MSQEQGGSTSVGGSRVASPQVADSEDELLRQSLEPYVFDPSDAEQVRDFILALSSDITDKPGGARTLGMLQKAMDVNKDTRLRSHALQKVWLSYQEFLVTQEISDGDIPDYGSLLKEIAVIAKELNASLVVVPVEAPAPIDRIRLSGRQPSDRRGSAVGAAGRPSLFGGQGEGPVLPQQNPVLQRESKPFPESKNLRSLSMLDVARFSEDWLMHVQENGVSNIRVAIDPRLHEELIAAFNKHHPTGTAGASDTILSAYNFRTYVGGFDERDWRQATTDEKNEWVTEVLIPSALRPASATEFVKMISAATGAIEISMPSSGHSSVDQAALAKCLHVAATAMELLAKALAQATKGPLDARKLRGPSSEIDDLMPRLLYKRSDYPSIKFEGRDYQGFRPQILYWLKQKGDDHAAYNNLLETLLRDSHEVVNTELKPEESNNLARMELFMQDVKKKLQGLAASYAKQVETLCKDTMQPLPKPSYSITIRGKLLMGSASAHKSSTPLPKDTPKKVWPLRGGHGLAALALQDDSEGEDGQPGLVKDSSSEGSDSDSEYGAEDDESDHGFGDRDEESHALAAVETRSRPYAGGGGDRHAHHHSGQRGGDSAPPKPPRQDHVQKRDFSGRNKYEGPRNDRYCIERTEGVCPVGTIKEPGVCPKGWSHKPELFVPAYDRKFAFKQRLDQECALAEKHKRDLTDAGMIPDTGRKPRA